jgi:hypothetical protein
MPVHKMLLHRMGSPGLGGGGMSRAGSPGLGGAGRAGSAGLGSAGRAGSAALPSPRGVEQGRRDSLGAGGLDRNSTGAASASSWTVARPSPRRSADASSELQQQPSAAHGRWGRLASGLSDAQTAVTAAVRTAVHACMPGGPASLR